ncbi:TPA: hypothetical protein ACH3X3_005129 [Trebouxia sp. C0006]
MLLHALLQCIIWGTNQSHQKQKMNAEKLDLLSDKVALRIQHQSGKFCADSVPSVEKLSKVVPAVSFSDAIYDWAGGDNRGAHAYTTTVRSKHALDFEQEVVCLLLFCST